MPIWSGVVEEIQQLIAQKGLIAVDEVRRKYLIQLTQHTGRNVILYAAHFTSPVSQEAIPYIQIIDEDMQGLMEAVHGLEGENLDLILHSPGGVIEATEALVIYLRSKFNHIRVIVPQLAQSAATMVACSANVIVLGKHSSLGPIDPQLLLLTPLGLRSTPAQSIVDQFARAKVECGNKDNFPAWAPMLPQYGPELLVRSENAIELSRELVRQWLEQWMFADDAEPDRTRKAAAISSWLGNHNAFRTHGRHIRRADLEAHELKVEHLEADPVIQDLILSIFHATTQSFNLTRCVKIIENQQGKGYFKIINPVPQAAPPSVAPKTKRGLIRRLFDLVFAWE